MDAERFDGITKKLAAGSGARRDVVKGLAGGLLAGALGLVGGRAALAHHKPSHCAKEGQKAEPGNSGKACCADLVEEDGRCVVPTQLPTCVEAKATCTLGVDTCCDETYSCGFDYCDPNQSSYLCCGLQGAACTTHCDCCGGLSYCDDSGHCNGPQ